MAQIGNKLFNNIAGAGETPIYQRTGGATGGASGGGNEILAQGYVYNTTSASITSKQIGFAGDPAYSYDFAGYHKIKYHFPGINILSHIIKVEYGGAGFVGVSSGARPWRIVGDYIQLQWGTSGFSFSHLDHYIVVEASPF